MIINLVILHILANMLTTYNLDWYYASFSQLTTLHLQIMKLSNDNNSITNNLRKRPLRQWFFNKLSDYLCVNNRNIAEVVKIRVTMKDLCNYKNKTVQKKSKTHEKRFLNLQSIFFSNFSKMMEMVKGQESSILIVNKVIYQ